jgi:hypothetical protein
MTLLETVKDEARRKVTLYAMIHLGEECQGYANMAYELAELLTHPDRNEGGDSVRIKERKKFLIKLLCEEVDNIQQIIRDIKRATRIIPK